MGTIVRAVVLYVVLVVAMRLIGRRGPNMMTPFELVLIFLLGGMAIQPIMGTDRSMTNAVLGVMTITLMHVSVATLKNWFPRFGQLVDGTPVMVFCTGKWHEDRMKSLRLQEQDVMAAARQQGVERLEQVKYAIVERNGGISIVKQDGVG